MKPPYVIGRRFGLFAAFIWIAAGCASEDVPDPTGPESVQVSEESSEPTEAFTLYRNDRFDYFVAYPDSLLIPQGESQNGDGQQFASPDSSVVLTAFGGNLFMEDSVASVFDRRMRSRRTDAGLILYSAQADSSFVISGTSGERIYHEKSIFYDDRMATIEMTYPIDRKAALDSVAARVSSSFGSGAF